MYVSHDRRSASTAGTCPSSVVVGGWLLTMAAIAAFAFGTADILGGDDVTVMSNRAIASYDQSLSAAGVAHAAGPATPRVVTAGVDNVPTPAPDATAAAPGRTCPARAAVSTASTFQRVGTRELTPRMTNTRGGSLSRVAASACRLDTSAKLNTATVSSSVPVHSSGAARPARNTSVTN